MRRKFRIRDLLVEDPPRPCPGHSWELIRKFSGEYYQCRHCEEHWKGPGPPEDGWTGDIQIPEE